MRLPPARRQAVSLRRRLLAHYDRHGRDLPWRRSTDPYRVLVAEVMLQQTTVAVVRPYYQRFLARFPDLHRLAAAGEEEVLGLWAGLGYYRRARSLHRACREVAESHQGRFPGTAAGLRELPGVGPYTAGAVASIAFGRPEPALDGNVVRVLSRLAASAGRDAASLGRLAAAARLLVAGSRPGDVNQALMDLGATICTPRSPACGRCPVRRSCQAARTGRPERFPQPVRRAPAEARWGMVLVVRTGGGILVVRRPSHRLLGGLWELPGIGACGDRAGRPGLGSVLAAAGSRLGSRLVAGGRLVQVRHTVLNRRIRLEVVAASIVARCGGWRERDDVRLLLPSRPLPPLTSAARKALQATGWLDQGRGRPAAAGTRMTAGGTRRRHPIGGKGEPARR